jgi:hypothetical protein
MHVLHAFSEEDYLRRVSEFKFSIALTLFYLQSSGFQKLVDMSPADLEIFCDSERQHVKEGILQLEGLIIIFIQFYS